MNYKQLNYLFKLIEYICVFNLITYIANEFYPILKADKVIEVLSHIVIILFTMLLYFTTRYVLNKIDLSVRDLTDNEIEAIKTIRKLPVGKYTFTLSRGKESITKDSLKDD